MKILLLAENWPPRVGGVENYLKNIVEHLPDSEVTVVAPKGNSQSLATEIKNSINVIRRRFFYPGIKPAWLPLFIWLYRQGKREKYDVVLCGKALFEGLTGYYLKKYLGIPYVVFTYAMEIEVWVNEPKEEKKLERVLKNADRVVYINGITKESLLKLGVKEKQLKKICPGVEERFFAEQSEKEINDVLGKYGVVAPYILTVARLIPRKGIDDLIEAFSQLDQTRFADVSLVVVGEGEEGEALKKLAGHVFVEESVRFLGAVPDEDLPALYQGAAVFALTPQQYEDDGEGFGIVYLEAAASGTPALATDTGGVKEAVVHEQTGLIVEEGSIEAVRQALSRLLSDDNLRKALGRQARERARQEFAWPKRIKLVKEMLAEIVNK